MQIQYLPCFREDRSRVGELKPVVAPIVTCLARETPIERSEGVCNSKKNVEPVFVSKP